MVPIRNDETDKGRKTEKDLTKPTMYTNRGSQKTASKRKKNQPEPHKIKSPTQEDSTNLSTRNWTGWTSS